MADILRLSEEDVAALVSLEDARDALRTLLSVESDADTFNITKALGVWPKGSVHALGAVSVARGYGCFKTWVNTPAGAAAVLTLFDLNEGAIVASIEAFTLGTLRTSAICAVATDALADPSASRMALIGTGRQALMQVAAVSTVRRLSEVAVFSPTPQNRDQFVAAAAERFPFPMRACATLQEALDQAQIITTVTRATSAFLNSGMVRASTHINAAGSVLPAQAEIEADVFASAASVIVDNKANAFATSKEIADWLSIEPDAGSRIVTLGQLLSQPRIVGDRHTIFKPMGMGLSDLAVAILVYERARSAGIGNSIASKPQQTPRWTSIH